MRTVKRMCGMEPFPDTVRGKTAVLLWTGLILLAASISISILILNLSTVKYGRAMFETFFYVHGLVLLNILPIVLLTFALWFLLGRADTAIAIPSVIFMALAVVNILKIRLRNDPLMFEDLLLVSEARGIAGQYNLSLDAEQWNNIYAAIGIILLTAILTRQSHLSRKRGWGKIRLIGFLVLTGMIGFLWKFVYLNYSVYQAVTNDYAQINHYSNVDDFQSRGFIYPFLYSYKSAVDPKPDGYRADEAAAVLSQYKDADIPDKRKVNIVAVMLEAYADLSDLTDNEAISDIYEPLHEIQEQSISGKMVSNVFAGGTNQTERSFITGYSRLGSFRSVSNSYARYLASQGYTVEGSHPGYDWFYNRVNINKNLGFENYYFFENYYSKKLSEDTLILDSDAAFFSEIVSLMKKSIKKTGKPYFSFNVSYQNHGPYADDSLFREDEIYVTPESTGWSQETCTILNNYLATAADTMEQMQKILDALENYDEPVVFVAFGDHMPWLGDNNSVYNETGMNIAEDTTEGYLNHYCTPFFIWANSAAKEVLDNDFVGDAGYLSPNFLMNEIFDQCGWKGDAYMQYLRTVRKVSPVTAFSNYLLIDGEVTDTPPEDAMKVFEQFKCVQYYRRKNFEE